MEAPIRRQRRLNGYPQKCKSRSSSTNSSIRLFECCCNVKNATPCACSSSNRSSKQNTASSIMHRQSRAKKTQIERLKTMIMRSPEGKRSEPLVHSCSNDLIQMKSDGYKKNRRSRSKRKPRLSSNVNLITPDNDGNLFFSVCYLNRRTV